MIKMKAALLSSMIDAWSNVLLPVWISIWLFRRLCLLKPLPQNGHSYGHEPLCTNIWLFKSPSVGKLLSHKLHLWGFSCKEIGYLKREKAWWNAHYLTNLVMSHFVIVQVAACCKSFSTNSTLMRLFTTMDSPASLIFN